MGKMKLYAGGSSHDYAGYQLIINLTGSMTYWVDQPTGFEGAAALCPSFLSTFTTTPYQDIPQLIIKWKDGGVPDFTQSQWNALILDLSAIKGRVYIHCMGGHGRTGTALAILLGLTKTLKKDPVEWLRKNYCQESVETQVQIEYIQSLGVKTSSKPSRLPFQQYVGIPYTHTQAEYELTKGTTRIDAIIDTKPLEPLFQCILCRRKHTGFHFYQTFLDGTGFCWSCHQLSGKTNGDEIQSA